MGKGICGLVAVQAAPTWQTNRQPGAREEGDTFIAFANAQSALFTFIVGVAVAAVTWLLAECFVAVG